MSYMIAIDWCDPELGIDHIPMSWFEVEGLSPSRTHNVLVPARGIILRALCDVEVFGEQAILNYASETCRRFNEKRVQMGTLKVNFKDEMRRTVERVFWKGECDENFQEYEVSITTIPAIESSDIDLLDVSAEEGEVRTIRHLVVERDRGLVEMKKRAVLKSKGRLVCEVCGFDFAEAYPGVGAEFCEVHHRVPLASLKGVRNTSLNDLAILCSNCHRMIHKTDPMESVELFRMRLKPH